MAARRVLSTTTGLGGGPVRWSRCSLGFHASSRSSRFLEHPFPPRRHCSGTSQQHKKKPVAGVGRGPVTWASVGILAAVWTGMAWWYTSSREKKMTRAVVEVQTTGKPDLGGPWTLVDQNGIPRTDKSYYGKVILLYFGFAHCPDICPAELVKVGNIIKRMDEKHPNLPQIHPVFITVDPERDSIAQLRYYSKDFDQRIQYLTGTKEQVARATRAYRVYFNKTGDHDDDEDYMVDHSIVLYLVGSDGELLDFFTQSMTVNDCVKKTSSLLAAK
eukprot:420875_1